MQKIKHYSIIIITLVLSLSLFVIISPAAANATGSEDWWDPECWYICQVVGVDQGDQSYLCTINNRLISGSGVNTKNYIEKSFANSDIYHTDGSININDYLIYAPFGEWQLWVLSDFKAIDPFNLYDQNYKKDFETIDYEYIDYPLVPSGQGYYKVTIQYLDVINDRKVTKKISQTLIYNNAFADNSILVNTTSPYYIWKIDELATAYNNGYKDGYQDGYDDGILNSYDLGYNNGKELGYQQGFEEGQIQSFDGYSWMRGLFGANGLGGLFKIELLPGLTIGALVMIPLILTLVPFIIGLFKGEGRKD